MMMRGDRGSCCRPVVFAMGELIKPDPQIVGVTGVIAAVVEVLIIPMLSESFKFLTLAPYATMEALVNCGIGNIIGGKGGGDA